MPVIRLELAARSPHRHMGHSAPKGMNMKRELAIAGIALVVSILLSAPTIAEPNRSDAQVKFGPAPLVFMLER